MDQVLVDNVPYVIIPEDQLGKTDVTGEGASTTDTQNTVEGGTEDGSLGGIQDTGNESESP
ncbi:hypothetical protein VQ056_06160 [Paenibacillus sp. JTLBN-2024]